MNSWFLLLVCRPWTSETVWILSGLSIINSIKDSIYWHGTGNISSLLNKPLQDALGSRAPRMRIIFNAHFSSSEPRKPLENLCTAQCFLLKGLFKHFMCFCGRFSEMETKSQADSLFGTVRHHDFTKGAWQHLGELTTPAHTTFYGDVRLGTDLCSGSRCNYAATGGSSSMQ